MANTKKYKKSTNKNVKRRTHSRMSSSKKHQELYAKNKKRNSIIRNIRMGRTTFNRIGGAGYMRKDGGGYTCQQGGSSQFVGAPWTVSNNPNTGNYFALSPLGVGTELVPKFDNGQPLYPAKFPTQLGPQVAKLGEIKGGGVGGGSYGYNKKKRNQKTIRSLIRGGGVFDDVMGVYNNAVSSATDFSSKLQGVNPPPSSYPWDQPIARNGI